MRAFRVPVVVLLLLASGCASTPPARSPAPPHDYGWRDPRAGLPRSAVPKRERRRLDEGMAALSSGELGRASDAFRSGLKSASEPLAFRLGLAYVDMAAGRLSGAREALDVLVAAAPAYAAAVEARADVDAADGRPREALDGYRALLRLAPGDERATRRAAEVTRELVAERRREAEAALAKGDVDAARRAAVAIVELEPSGALGLQLLARAADAGGRADDAWLAAQRARAIDPSDRSWTAFVAELASRTGRHAEAAVLFGELAAIDPSYAERAKEARLSFDIQTLPDVPRRAASSSKLTRAQLASLLWALVPEVRAAQPPRGSDVAVDAVDLPESAALVRAIRLGFFAVSKETHRVGAQTPVNRAELVGALKRVAALAARRRKSRSDCLSGPDVTMTSLTECGILSEASARWVTGREAVAAISAAVRAARGGGVR